jgi:hypothetical protein
VAVVAPNLPNLCLTPGVAGEVTIANWQLPKLKNHKRASKEQFSMTSSNTVRSIRGHKINDRQAETIFLAITFRASDERQPFASNDDWICCWTIKELAREVGLTVREVYEKIRLLRSLDMIATRACSDGYLFVLKERLHQHSRRRWEFLESARNV